MVTDKVIRLRLRVGETPNLAEHPIVQAGAGKPRTSQQRVVYFDTPDLKLHHAGIHLTLSQEKKGWVQRLASGQGRKQREVRATLKAEALDLKALKKGKGAKLLGKVKPAALGRLFALEVNATQWRICYPDGARLLLTHQQGGSEFADHGHQFNEVVVQLLSGEPDRLFQTALTLAYELEPGLQCATPLERAFERIVSGAVATPWQGVALSPKMTAEDAYITINSAILATVRANLCAALFGNEARRAEGLHQIHGAVTRLRAMVVLYDSLLPPDIRSELDEELKWLVGELEPAHAWEGFVREILEPFTAHFPEYATMEPLKAAAEGFRARAFQRMDDALRSFRATRLILGAANWLSGQGWRDLNDGPQRLRMARPAGDWAAEALGRHHRHVRKLGKRIVELPAEERLRLREEGDLLLAAVDFFSGLFKSRAQAPYQKDLEGVQAILRTLDGLEDAQRLFETAFPKEDDPTVHLIRGWLGARKESNMQKTEAAWKRFSGRPAYW